MKLRHNMPLHAAAAKQETLKSIVKNAKVSIAEFAPRIRGRKNSFKQISKSKKQL